MRKNNLNKTKHDNIYTFTTTNAEVHFYLNFELRSKRYQNKNITKLFGVRTLTKAKDKFEEIKTMIRQGEDPFRKNLNKETIQDIITEQIANKKSKYKDKDNSRYKNSLTIFYDKYIDDTIGHLKFDVVTKTHVNKIMKKIQHLSSARQELLKVLMYNEFETRFRNREIAENPFYNIDYGKKNKKIKLDIRLNESLEVVAQKLYLNIVSSNYISKLLLIINLMCARRVGEIYKLLYEDIKKDADGKYFVLAHPNITKTGIYEKYPLPKEAIDLLPSDILDIKNAKKSLFEFHHNTIFLNHGKLIEKSKIDINKNFKITSHDSRNIFISLLVKKGFDSELADACLSHSKSDSKSTYLEIGYEKRSEIFEEYWKILRVEMTQPKVDLQGKAGT